MSDKTKSGQSDQSGKPSAESTDTGKTLAQRLEEFEAATAKAKAAPSNDGAKDEMASLKAEVAKLRAAEGDRVYRREMDDNLIPALKGDLDVHPKHVERWLNEQAASDPKLMKAWENRDDDPDAFKAAIDALKPKFEAAAKDEGLIGTKSKDDAKLKSALRSARTTGSDALSMTTDLNSMGDSEFAMHKAEVFKQAQAGQL